MEKKMEYSICFSNGKYVNVGSNRELVLFNSKMINDMGLRSLMNDMKEHPNTTFVNLNNVNFIKMEESLNMDEFKL